MWEDDTAVMSMRFILLLVLSLLVETAGRGQRIDATNTTVLRNVVVIDTLAGKARPSLTVVINGTRIVDVGSASLSFPSDAEVIDGTGKFLIPGLWDMHTHGVGIPGIQDFTGPLLIANGITGVRNLGQDRLSDILARRAEIEAGSVIGPRIVASGQIIDGPAPVWVFAVAVRSTEAARRTVKEQKTNGADFIKIYTLLPRAEFFAIADEAKMQSIPLVGHVPLGVTATEASNAGMKSMEHLHGVVLEASSKAADIAEQGAIYVRRAAAGSPQTDAAGGLAGFVRLETDATLTYDPTVAKRLFRTFKRNHTWQVPTLVAKQDWAYDDDPGSF
jgi:imidazolonepropionase-like amidohydrolase